MGGWAVTCRSCFQGAPTEIVPQRGPKGLAGHADMLADVGRLGPQQVGDGPVRPPFNEVQNGDLAADCGKPANHLPATVEVLPRDHDIGWVWRAALVQPMHLRV